MTKRNKFPRSRWIGLLLAPLAIAAGVAGTALLSPARAAEFTVYKSPWCGCCGEWIKRMKAKGHSLTIKNIENLDPIKKIARVPERLRACHTAIGDGYVIEGHVPSKDIERLLAERPKAIGLAVPGMPSGSPGMDGGEPESYDVILFKADGSESVYARY